MAPAAAPSAEVFTASHPASFNRKGGTSQPGPSHAIPSCWNTHSGALWLPTSRALAWEMSRGQQKDGAYGVKLRAWERENAAGGFGGERINKKQKAEGQRSTALSVGYFGLLWLEGSRLGITCLHWRDMPRNKARSRNFQAREKADGVETEHRKENLAAVSDWRIFS